MAVMIQSRRRPLVSLSIAEYSKMASAQALLTLIMGSISKTTIGVTTSSLAERNGCSSHSFLTLVASIGRPVSSHASRLCRYRHCQLGSLIII